MCAHALVSTAVCEVQKEVAGLLELESRAVMTHTPWVLGIELCPLNL